MICFVEDYSRNISVKLFTQLSFCQKLIFWHQTSSCKYSMCLYCVCKVSDGFSKSSQTDGYKNSTHPPNCIMTLVIWFWRRFLKFFSYMDMTWICDQYSYKPTLVPVKAPHEIWLRRAQWLQHSLQKTRRENVDDNVQWTTEACLCLAQVRSE